MLAAFLDKPVEISPYVPVSRLFWNELYVDPRQAPEFAQAPAAARLAHAHFFQQDIQKLRGTALVDHARLMTLKRPLLEAMARWLAETKPERYAQFQSFVDSHPRLRDYAAFRAATEKQGKPWMQWPQRLRGGKLQAGDYDSAAEQYHLYAQWLAEEQMQTLAAKDRRSGAGLYLDYPLGVHPDGYDAWRERALFAQGADAGAPPDSLFAGGQKWGFPPLHPEALREDRYRYVIECMRHQFRHASWVRLDHVMGLHRLFWVPAARTPKEGVYVRYHPEEWYAIICLESHRAKTVVVGENLGTVPPEVTREMGRRGLKPMYVLQYEATSGAPPLRPIPASAAASLNTHDMPPFASFWKGGDLKDLAELGVFDAADARRRLAARREICRAVERFLRKRTRKGGSKAAAGSAPMQDALEWLAASDAKLLLVNLEDLWLETEPQNVPGTRFERPNWQRKARLSFEEFSSDPRVTSLLQSIARLRSGSTSRKTTKPAGDGK
jgi:4-alpha-glucanotransferase